MSRLQLSKSSLAKETQSLKTYQRFLPSLDLKRQQLMVERAKAQKEYKTLESQQADLLSDVSRKLPMMANHEIDLSDLVWLHSVEIKYENIVGTRLPLLESIVIHTKNYNLHAKPHWVDAVCRMLHQAIELKVKLQVQQARIERLNSAVVTVTQRVNLFDKVLIPKARENIKRIRIYLSDEQMVSVVRSKIAKRKNTSQGNQPVNKPIEDALL